MSHAMKRLKKDTQGTGKTSIWWYAGLVVAIGLVVASTWLIMRGQATELTEAPEAEQVLALQAQMPFQILIPAYLPKGFDRERVEITVDELGPGGEPMVLLAYHDKKGTDLFIREWVPVNPDMETLASSRPVATKWGRGWLLRQGESLVALWSDIGPLRVSIYTPNPTALPAEQILGIADNMGPASNQQVFSFLIDTPLVAEIPPAPPVEIPINEQGIQEVDLIVTPGGYSPLRFAVKAGVPVHLTFRQLGEVGCGNELIFPSDPTNPTALYLESESDVAVYDFTPQSVGEFMFYCSHQMYRGIMTVRQ
jgi:hypothetical protein